MHLQDHDCGAERSKTYLSEQSELLGLAGFEIATSIGVAN